MIQLPGMATRLAIDRETYRRRNMIERCVNRPKAFLGIATKYEKNATSHEGAVILAPFLL